MKHIGHMRMGQKDSEVQKEGTLAVKLQDGLKLEISINQPKPVLPQAFRSEPDLSQSVPIHCPFPSRNQPPHSVVSDETPWVLRNGTFKERSTTLTGPVHPSPNTFHNPLTTFENQGL